MTSQVIECLRPAGHPWHPANNQDSQDMNTRFAATCGWMLVLAVPLAASPAVVRAATTAARADVIPQYVRLAALSGHWDVQQSIWPDPQAPAVVDHGTATYAMVLGGHHLRQALHIASSKPFDGLGYIGYDDAAHTYYSTWMDTNFTGIVLARGTYDAARRTYVFNGEMADKDGSPVPVREVMRIADNDHFVYEYYETRNGREALAVRLQYTRTD
jgi:hypothetical protein